MSKLHNWEVVMLISEQARALLQKGNLQEQRNKEFILQLATSMMLVLLAGFLAGFISGKSLTETAHHRSEITQKSTYE